MAGVWSQGCGGGPCSQDARLGWAGNEYPFVHRGSFRAARSVGERRPAKPRTKKKKKKKNAPKKEDEGGDANKKSPATPVKMNGLHRELDRVGKNGEDKITDQERREKATSANSVEPIN